MITIVKGGNDSWFLMMVVVMYWSWRLWWLLCSSDGVVLCKVRVLQNSEYGQKNSGTDRKFQNSSNFWFGIVNLMEFITIQSSNIVVCYLTLCIPCMNISYYERWWCTIVVCSKKVLPEFCRRRKNSGSNKIGQNSGSGAQHYRMVVVI